MSVLGWSVGILVVIVFTIMLVKIEKAKALTADEKEVYHRDQWTNELALFGFMALLYFINLWFCFWNMMVTLLIAKERRHKFYIGWPLM
jgi:Ca2+/Na+ antiporter